MLGRGGFHIHSKEENKIVWAIKIAHKKKYKN